MRRSEKSITRGSSRCTRDDGWRWRRYQDRQVHAPIGRRLDMSVNARQACRLELVTTGPTQYWRQGFQPLHCCGRRIIQAEQRQSSVGDGEIAAIGSPRVLHAEHAAIELLPVGLEAPLCGLAASIQQQFQTVRLCLLLQTLVNEHCIDQPGNAGRHVHGAIDAWSVRVSASRPGDLSQE